MKEELEVHNIKRRVMGSLMAVLMGTSTILGTCPTPLFAATTSNATTETEVKADATAVNANSYGLASETEGNILHAWDWKFTDVTENMKVIAESGYSNVQVSPCQTIRENVSNNGSWWQFYQPTDFAFCNSLGTEDEFKAMCDEAKKYGVNIIVDIVSNHLAGSDTALDGKVADKWKSNTGKYFHNYGSDYKANDDNDRKRMVTGTIGMPDLNTEDSDVQNAITSYLGKLMDLGADGFRFDAAKHIGTPSDSGECQSNYWKVIADYVKGKNANALLYGEILNTIPVSIDYYTPYIKVTESQKGWDMKDLTHGSAVSDKLAFQYTRTTPDKNLITWVESHDTFCNANQETGTPGTDNYMSNDQIILCWSTVASRANAQSLFFARPEGIKGEGSGANRKVTVLGNLGINTKDNSWKDTRVAAVNKFKNAMVGEGESCSTNGNLAIIKRGNKGVVVTNFGSGSANFNVSRLSGLKDGKYTDASGQNGEFTVSGGKVSGSVKGNTFVVLYDADATVEETDAPTATPEQTPESTDAASISLENGGGDFTEAVKETITVKNAEYAYYSNDGAEWTEIKNGKATVTIGADAKNIGDTYALYVKAMGKDGKMVDTEKTYTYKSKTSTDAGQTHSLKIRIPKKDFSSAPHVYFKNGTKWPGETMTAEGDYWVYVSDELTSGEVIFNDGSSWQDPIMNASPAFYTVAGYMEYDKSSKTVTEFTEQTEATVSPDAKKANKAPGFVGPTTEPTATPEVTTGGVVTATPEPTQTPVETKVPEELKISVSKEDGTQFDAETLPVDIKVENGTDAVYTIDDGAEVSFDGETTVQVGEGKIGNTDVTLKVAATDKEGTRTAMTYTYKKVFNPKKAAQEQKVGNVTTAVAKIQSLMEVVADAAQADAAAESDAYYATNPGSKVGKKASIKIDGSFSDWSDDMLIAQGAAFDTATAFKGQWENCVMDSYSLYGAWDDENLYIGFQLVNVYDDALKDSGMDLAGGPLSCNGKIGDLPITLAINTGKGNAMTGRVSDGKGIWGQEIEFKTRVDNILVFHGDNSGTPGFFTGTEDGTTNYKANCQNFDDLGIEVESADGCLPKTIMGVKDNKGDVQASYSMDSAWIDFNTTTHDNKYDTFYEVKIPFKALGITASDVENNGVGVMQLIGRGESGMDCIPHDPSMLDNTMGDYAAQPTNSHEKDDTDIITVPLAAVGNMKATGEGAGGNVSTPNPATATPDTTDSVATATPDTTDSVATATPDTTDSVATATPEATATDSVATATPEVTATAEVTATPEATAIPVEDTDQMVVNFGAEKAAPQVAGTTIKLEAKPYNTTGKCEYQFTVDGNLVQKYSEKSTYDWFATTGKHTIRVAVKDETGKYVVVEKSYTVMGETPATQTPTVTATATTEPTATPTDVPVTPTAVPTEVPVDIVVKASFGKASPQKVNTAIKITPRVSGTNNSYKYSVMAELKNSTYTQRVASNTTAKSVTWKPKKAGTYKLTISVTDSEGNKGVKTYNYVIKQPKLTVSAKISKKKITAGQKVKITASGTASKGTLKFKITSKKKGAKKTTVLKAYNTKKTYTGKIKKAGTYTITVYAKDGSGKQVKKTLKLTVKAKKKVTKKKK